MTELQLFAFVVLPIIIAVAGGLIAWQSRSGLNH